MLELEKYYITNILDEKAMEVYNIAYPTRADALEMLPAGLHLGITMRGFEIALIAKEGNVIVKDCQGENISDTLRKQAEEENLDKETIKASWEALSQDIITIEGLI